MKKILIVEDDPEVAAILSLHLKKNNYEALVALDALQAFQLMQKEQPDLLLLDINIPAGSGFSVAEKVRTFPKFMSTPFIFLTGSKDKNIHEAALELGPKAILEKPYQIQDLLKIIDEVLK